MFRLPFARAFMRSSPSLASLPHRTASSTQCASLPAFRTISSIPPNLKATCPRTLYQSLPPRRVPRRPFSNSARRDYGFGNNRYKRFSGSTQESLFARLIRDARPHHFVIVGVGIGGFYVYNTDTVEMTGRRRFNCVSVDQELKMGQQSYYEVLQQERGKILPENHPVTVQVSRVLSRLIPEAPIEGANWKVHVIHDNNMVNAFVLPGGKVFVYTGILPVCEDEHGLAAVLGHEIAHVVAHHPAERMSNSIISLGAVFLIAMLFDISGHIPSLLLNLMYSLPNSRTQEAEADNIGLMMMAKACYNPQAAVRLWARMQEAEKEAPPQFMSTHPSSYNRMEAIRGWLDKANFQYEEAGCHSMGSFIPGFRQAYGDFGRH